MKVVFVIVTETVERIGIDSKPISLCVEDQDYMGRIKKLQEYLNKVPFPSPSSDEHILPHDTKSRNYILAVRTIIEPGCSLDILKAAISIMSSVTDVLSVMLSPTSNCHTLFPI
ncbi:hypothetical protein MLD38_012800 [Melastoma candidum]|uniref:Uncharacterized protein n=1 Tax=Melastoma candidum TaxID=119954 RepID=A0ACB9R830_9MYRT|nr:hypothetical protein MLD38_012800 [Melastoma candidum]